MRHEPVEVLRRQPGVGEGQHQRRPEGEDQSGDGDRPSTGQPPFGEGEGAHGLAGGAEPGAAAGAASKLTVGADWAAAVAENRDMGFSAL